MPQRCRVLAAVLALATVSMTTARAANRAPARQTVVFVCEHGSAKSLVAASLLERMARKEGLAIDAVSRGTAPDASVPAGVVQSLGDDGFDVAAFRPQALTAADVARAARVVAIGVDLGPLGAPAGHRAVRWDGVPPVSTRYPEARRDLTARIEGLLRELKAARVKR